MVKGRSGKWTFRSQAIFIFIIFCTTATCKRVLEDSASLTVEREIIFAESGDSTKSNRFDSWTRSSRYLSMRDGVKLAMDVIRPAQSGTVAAGKFPVLWVHTRMPRALKEDDAVRSMIEFRSDLRALVLEGYIVVLVEARGSGASFGVFDAPFSKDETRDAYEITEWLASQSWCNGKVAMIGRNYEATASLMAAGEAPPALKTVFSIAPIFDSYENFYPGGDYDPIAAKKMIRLTGGVSAPEIFTPVDEDPERNLLDQALKMRTGNWRADSILPLLPFRDSSEKQVIYHRNNPMRQADDIVDAGTPVFLCARWGTASANNALLWFANLDTLGRALIFPAIFGGKARNERKQILQEEQVQWFGRWMQDEKTSDQPFSEIVYATRLSSKEWAWERSATWPPENSEPVEFVFHADELLSPQLSNLPEQAPASFAVTSREKWQTAFVHTSEPFADEIKVTGHPVVSFEISADSPDLAFCVKLEEVEASGAVRSLSSGKLVASHRKQSKPRHNVLGAPWRRSFEEDTAPLVTDEPTRLEFALYPFSAVFQAGTRIRATILCKLVESSASSSKPAPTTVKLHYSPENPSVIMLPVITPAIVESPVKSD